MDDWSVASVMELQRNRILRVEDGNHGEHRPRPDEFVDAGVAFIRATDMDRGRVLFESAARINDRARQRITKGIGAPGDILLSHKGTVGKVALVSDHAPPFVCSPQTTFWRTLNSRRLDRKYLYAFLRSPGFHAQLLARAGETDMAPYVSLTSQRGLLVTLPPIDEQRAIAYILGTLDDKIDLNRRINDTLEATGRALFKSWFVDFDPVRAKADGGDVSLPNDAGALFPNSFQASELGQIPAGWTVNAVERYARCVKGTSYRSDELRESQTALVTLKSFARRGGYRQEGLKPYAGNHKPEQVVYPGELVVACTDVTQAAEVIGKPALVRSTDKFSKLVASLDVLIVRSIAPEANVPFLYCLFRTNDFADHTYAHSTGTTVLHLSKQAVPSFRFVVPTRGVAAAFASIAGPMFDRLDRGESESATLATLRDTLLAKLISGELRIRDAERIAATSA